MKDYKPKQEDTQGLVALWIVVVVFGGLFIYELLNWSNTL